MNKKNIINFLILLILIVAIPLLIKLAQNQQIFRSRAATGATGVTFSGPNVGTSGNKTTLKLDGDGNANVDLIITSPLGPPAAGSSATPTTSPIPSPTRSPTSSVTPTPTPTPTPTGGIR